MAVTRSHLRPSQRIMRLAGVALRDNICFPAIFTRSARTSPLTASFSRSKPHFQGQCRAYRKDCVRSRRELKVMYAEQLKAADRALHCHARTANSARVSLSYRPVDCRIVGRTAFGVRSSRFGRSLTARNFARAPQRVGGRIETL